MPTDSLAFSLITTCKGRLSDLRKTIVSWLDLQGPAYEIIVVDYDCPDGTAEFVRSHQEQWQRNHRVVSVDVVAVNDKPFFNLNDARNRGMEVARAPYALMIDADVTIEQNDILGWLSEAFRLYTIFVGHVMVLHGGIEEGWLYYHYEYDSDIGAALYLPLLAEHISLSGTSCFEIARAKSCGFYNPILNETGYGADDLEFYLRYLNAEILTNEATPAIADLSRVSSFPVGAFVATDNTDEEKHRFYPKEILESAPNSKIHVRRTLSSLLESKPFSGITTTGKRTTLVFGRTSIDDVPRKVPVWFIYWFYYWYGIALGQRGRLKDCKHLFPLWLFEPLQSSDLQQKQRHNYRMGSLAYRLGFLNQASKLLSTILAERSASPSEIIAGANYYLGEISSIEGKYDDSIAFFLNCLKIIPRHRKAQIGLSSLNYLI